MTDEIASFKVTAADIQEQRKATFRGRPHDLGGHFFGGGGVWPDFWLQMVKISTPIPI